MSTSSGRPILTIPEPRHKEAVLDYRDEFLQNGETIHGSGNIEHAASYESWLQSCTDSQHRATVPEGRVPATQYIAIRRSDNRLVGMLQIRHELNKGLRIQGGHIGYSVRKSERRKGYATEMLKQALVICKKHGIQEVLLTCSPLNTGSAKVIKSNGGVYDKGVILPNEEKLDHYWIREF